MKLVEFDVTALKKAEGPEKEKFAQAIIQQLYDVGFIRCVNIPGYNEGMNNKLNKSLHFLPFVKIFNYNSNYNNSSNIIKRKY